MNLLEEKIKSIDIKLASKSPRRHQLLRNIIKDFEIVSNEIDESYPKSLKANEIALYLSNLKAKSYEKEAKENQLYITADTIVVYQQKVLGKPKNEKDAFNMLQELSGKTHRVYTGVSLLFNGEINSFVDATEVTFYDLSEDEIKFYIDYHRPMDKAGSYGIQEWMGYVGVKKNGRRFFQCNGTSITQII